MAKYVIISALTDEGAKTLKKNPERVYEFNAELHEMGINVLEQYAILGDIDFLSIVEADSEANIFKALVEIASRGSIKTSTYRAMPMDKFIESLK